MTCGGENGPNGSHFPVFSEDIVIAHHFVATHPPIPSHHIGVLVVLAMPIKNYLKWWEIQLAIQCTITLNSYGFMEKHMQAAPIILEIYIELNISKLYF